MSICGPPPAIREAPSLQVLSPPSTMTIMQGTKGQQFRRSYPLGTGATSEVFELWDSRDRRFACKTMKKDTKPIKIAAVNEVKALRTLSHPNIVRCYGAFEDKLNIYLILELCPNGSLMDMVRSRGRITEPEARKFMVQLIGACVCMHGQNIVHRDLKLSNVFLDANLNVKLGDFGLSDIVRNRAGRPPRACGTPHYMAPETISGDYRGCSIEVDVWSLGIILFAMVIGRTPFRGRTINEIYQRIRDMQYTFPADRPVSFEARTLVQTILKRDPEERPSLQEIISHDFFSHSIFPASLPQSARLSLPDFSHITREESRRNFARLRRSCLLGEGGEEMVTTMPTPAAFLFVTVDLDTCRYVLSQLGENVLGKRDRVGLCNPQFPDTRFVRWLTLSMSFTYSPTFEEQLDHLTTILSYPNMPGYLVSLLHPPPSCRTPDSGPRSLNAAPSESCLDSLIKSFDQKTSENSDQAQLIALQCFISALT